MWASLRIHKAVSELWVVGPWVDSKWGYYIYVTGLEPSHFLCTKVAAMKLVAENIQKRLLFYEVV